MGQFAMQLGAAQQRRSLRIAVLLEANGRGGSREVHGALRLGQQLAIRGLRNAFTMQEGEAYLFVAGGIGVTPIMAMAQTAQRAGFDWQMLYGGRSRQSMAFIDELQVMGAGRVEVVPMTRSACSTWTPLWPLHGLGVRFTAVGRQRCWMT
ncbi:MULTISPECIES: hypothetical protein [Pseudomonas]|uniref:hypothetical protein n=2 Tax=Pseudomonas TaxID=286 RepID=UPI00224B88A9|nr:hypothetical protein [Pseudomonas sp. DCB_BI]